MKWILKKLVSNQLGVKYPHGIFDIFNCYRSDNTVFDNVYVCLCWELYHCFKKIFQLAQKH